MAAVASLIALVGRLAPLLGESQGGRHLSLPKNLLAGVGATIVFGWILVSLSAFVHLVAWQGRSPDPGAVMNLVALCLAHRGDGRAGRALRPHDPLRQQLVASGALWQSADAGLSRRLEQEPLHQRGRPAARPIRSRATTSAGASTRRSKPAVRCIWSTSPSTRPCSARRRSSSAIAKGLPMAIGPCGLSAGLESHALWKQRHDGSRRRPDARLGRAPAGAEHRLGQAGPARADQGFHLFATPKLEPHPVEALSVGNVDGDLRRRVLDRPGGAHQPRRIAAARHRQRAARLLVELVISSRATARACGPCRPSAIASASRSTAGSRCRRTCSRSSPRGSTAPTASAGI